MDSPTPSHAPDATTKTAPSIAIVAPCRAITLQFNHSSTPISPSAFYLPAEMLHESINQIGVLTFLFSGFNCPFPQNEKSIIHPTKSGLFVYIPLSLTQISDSITAAGITHSQNHPVSVFKALSTRGSSSFTVLLDPMRCQLGDTDRTLSCMRTFTSHLLMVTMQSCWIHTLEIDDSCSSLHSTKLQFRAHQFNQHQ